MSDSFGSWLQRERENRKLTQAKLAQLSKLNRAVINKIENNASNPTPETLKAIASALNLSPESVFRAAGILDPIPPDDQRVENWREILRLLTPEEEAELREIGLLKIKRREAASRIKHLKQPPGNDD